MPAGRPKAKAELTAAQVERLAKIGCADDEIAALAGIAESTLQENFRAHLTKGRAQLRERLRRRQLRRALDDGSDTMLIWLGKQYLGQRDKNDLSLREEPPDINWDLVPEPLQIDFLERRATLAQIVAFLAQQRRAE